MGILEFLKKYPLTPNQRIAQQKNLASSGCEVKIGILVLGILNLGILDLKFSRNSRIPRKLLKTKVPYSKLAALSTTL